MENITNLHKALVESDQANTYEEAQEIIDEMVKEYNRSRRREPENILADYGLEADFVVDLNKFLPNFR